LQVVTFAGGEPSIAHALSCSPLSSQPRSVAIVGGSPRVGRFGFCLGRAGDALVSPCYAASWLSSSLAVPYLYYVVSVNSVSS
jgi:hypothetical protein